MGGWAGKVGKLRALTFSIPHVLSAAASMARPRARVRAALPSCVTYPSEGGRRRPLQRGCECLHVHARPRSRAELDSMSTRE